MLSTVEGALLMADWGRCASRSRWLARFGWEPGVVARGARANPRLPSFGLLLTAARTYGSPGSGTGCAPPARSLGPNTVTGRGGSVQWSGALSYAGGSNGRHLDRKSARAFGRPRSEGDFGCAARG